MAATYEPSTKVSILTAASQKAKETKTARLSYALGIVNGLEQDVKEGQRKEEENRKEKLRRAQQRAAGSGEAHQESDDESQQGELAKDEASSNDLNKLEQENTAHLALIDHHKKIATDVLKVCNTALLYIFTYDIPYLLCVLCLFSQRRLKFDQLVSPSQFY